eukprot:TRINITY_DN573_c0_g1_i1.p1 TRINITY_DN573_c0_g1~~TRINITY_DN573_c0_g1_i1.p1  ORF type:complete len:267 (-),score=74.98 TRINITY_DN573_c0_g1_i1:152-952(-)
MLVKIKDLKGVVTEIANLPENPSVLELKTQVEERLSIPRDVQRLIFSGKELTDNDLRLSDYNINDGTTVHLVVRTKPKAKAAITPYVADPTPQQQQQQQNQDVAVNVDNPFPGEFGDFAQMQMAAAAAPEVANMNVEAVFDTVRVSRTVKLIALCQLFEVLAFAIINSAIFPVALLAICGIAAAETLRPHLLIPFILLQLLNVVVVLVVFLPAKVGTAFVVLNILISAWVTFIAIRFYKTLIGLTPAEIAEARSLQRIHAAGGAGF